MKKSHLLVSLLSISHCVSADEFQSPEAAVRFMEDAYTRRDTEAAVAARDFTEEARRMLKRIDPKLAGEVDILKQTAEVLELGYRNDLKKTIFPRFKGVKCTITEVVPIEESLVKVNEDCVLKNGKVSREELFVAKSVNGWRVVTISE